MSEGDGRLPQLFDRTRRAPVMATEHPTVSVIMPAYNAASHITRPIDSVLAQSHGALELLVIDDGSSDATVAMVEAQARRDRRVRLLRQPVNGGVAAARNAGIAAAAGSHIAFLDSDDWWHPHKLERQLQKMAATGATLCYAPYDRVSEDDRLLSQVRPPTAVTYRDMLKSNRIGNLTGIYDRRLGDLAFQNIGHEDYVFWLDMVRRAGRAVCVDSNEPLAWYLVRKGSISADKLKAARWQWAIYREVVGLGPLASAYFMGHYAWHALHKRR